MVGVHLVDQADLHPVADGELPLDGVVGGVGGAVDQLPAGVGRRGDPVDVDHVVLPLAAAGRGVVVRVVGVRLVVVVVMPLGHLALLVAHLVVLVVVAPVLDMLVPVPVPVPVAGGLRHQLHPHRLHAAAPA